MQPHRALVFVILGLMSTSCSSSDPGADANKPETGTIVPLKDAGDHDTTPHDAKPSVDMVEADSSPVYPGCPAEPFEDVPFFDPIGPCVTGQTIWCDGFQYGGWGKAKCKADGSWPTMIHNDRLILLCQELADGGRPDTDCACHHFYFNSTCCECEGCIVPDGASVRACPRSPGRLCDYCNPQDPECIEDGAECLTTKSYETYCGRPCEEGQPATCPFGYTCLPIATGGSPTHQCVPEDLSCFFDK